MHVPCQKVKSIKILITCKLFIRRLFKYLVVFRVNFTEVFRLCSIKFDWVRLIRKSNAIELSHTNFWVRLSSIIELIEPNRSIIFMAYFVQSRIIVIRKNSRNTCRPDVQ